MRTILAIFFYLWTVLFVFYFLQELPAFYNKLTSKKENIFGIEKKHKDFFNFCNLNIPTGKSVYLITPNLEMQFGVYYLFPRNFNRNSDYVIVYNIEDKELPNFIEKEKYKIFKVFNSRGYILIK